MKFSKLLQVKPSRIKTKLNISKCLMNEAKEKRKHKNGKRIRDFKSSEEGKNKLILRWQGEEQKVEGVGKMNKGTRYHYPVRRA